MYNQPIKRRKREAIARSKWCSSWCLYACKKDSLAGIETIQQIKRQFKTRMKIKAALVVNFVFFLLCKTYVQEK